MVTKKRPTEPIALRVIVKAPLPNLRYALQLGKDTLVEPTASTKHCITFDFSVDVLEDGPNGMIQFRGPAVQGRAGGRFVYVRIGTYAGQTGTDVAGRAKISLEGITSSLLGKVRTKPGGVLEVQFAGTDSKGEAACATVPLLGSGWYVA